MPALADDPTDAVEWNPTLLLKHRLAISMDRAEIKRAEDISRPMGVHVNTVRNWLSGRTVPSRPAIRVWADLTGVPYEWLVGDAA